MFRRFCCLAIIIFSSTVSYAGGFGGGGIAPHGTTYVRQNIFGGHDYYNRQGKIGWSRKTNMGNKYYNQNGMYLQERNGRIYINPNIKMLGD